MLLVSFGGPEAPEDVVPFLENVTRGRGIPRERLVEVGQHYFDFGGRSPINDQCRELLACLRAALAEAGSTIDVYWGNRNWRPYLGDELAKSVADGHRRILALTTSAYPSYSSCRQYRENLHDAVTSAAVQNAAQGRAGSRSTASVSTPPILDSSPRPSTPPTPRSARWARSTGPSGWCS